MWNVYVILYFHLCNLCVSLVVDPISILPLIRTLWFINLCLYHPIKVNYVFLRIRLCLTCSECRKNSYVLLTYWGVHILFKLAVFASYLDWCVLCPILYTLSNSVVLTLLSYRQLSHEASTIYVLYWLVHAMNMCVKVLCVTATN